MRAKKPPPSQKSCTLYTSNVFSLPYNRITIFIRMQKKEKKSLQTPLFHVQQWTCAISRVTRERRFDTLIDPKPYSWHQCVVFQDGVTLFFPCVVSFFCVCVSFLVGPVWLPLSWSSSHWMKIHNASRLINRHWTCIEVCIFLFPRNKHSILIKNFMIASVDEPFLYLSPFTDVFQCTIF